MRTEVLSGFVSKYCAAVVILVAALFGLTAVPAHADNVVPPPYVDHVEWAKWGDLSSLRVYPTPAGRAASGIGSGVGPEHAWAEVLALAPEAERPGMYEQFVCHWQFAELVEPGKISWNLEPWRPAVPLERVIEAGCNPGGTEEPF
ncbi:hypothetical protein C731_0714 [Mycolicibacterium hassiacum DSM 44199]|jgi:hypothetical protein|uniref:Uncharacterized protein n=1 Tax=Mycolicibacterium hassiacum (strain DSM 44199 / CIP 105218 / JCM 12690 / 3849) TaxID=1122247 RepID=K5BH24_MYCHD|nr:DUF2599 domain-containing protein [Mycolicibacterium hassiacum]EKF25282.1 hypothetical protein C731_0714 [Mycolicibacterium hassiacum DSM 44199]MBX5488838.1 DUF2599 domain-containing protein [Mycolicibacterium hassiacum]MDA4087815.1 hypothetical protein [Mycolicibacterium hassiacum DSM 44199]PZN25290.1 MAG: DUF2599 domain-containing protein [Mycolicibacterium hassiacum]VCT93107.1 hypothetical protein MHAS_04845 [Mycolicibacterium hassiacum DSM 44199]